MVSLLKTSGNLKRESEWEKSRYVISRISSKLACLDLCLDFFNMERTNVLTISTQGL